MALSQIYSAVAGDTITAARWNNEFGNLYTNGTDVAFPVTKAVSFAGYTVTLDASGVTTLSSTTSCALAVTPGSKAGAASVNGHVLTLNAAQFTDTSTAASGTATQQHAVSIRTPSLLATNLSVTTTDAATVYIENAPTASTNQTITKPWALFVDAGAVRFDGKLVMTAGSIVQAEGADVASAATTNIWATDGDSCHITGTTGITSFGTAAQAGQMKLLIFDGVVTLTHSANMALPGAVDITTAAGDSCLVRADTTTQHDMLWFSRATGKGWQYVSTSSPVAVSTLTISSLTIAKRYRITFDLSFTANVAVRLRFNADAGANYGWGCEVTNDTTDVAGTGQAGQTSIDVTGGQTAAANDDVNGVIEFRSQQASANKASVHFTTARNTSGGGSAFYGSVGHGLYNGAASISSVNISVASGTFTGEVILERLDG